MPTSASSDEPRDANLFSDDRQDAAQPAAAPAPDDGEDPFDTIFRIFNNK